MKARKSLACSTAVIALLGASAAFAQAAAPADSAVATPPAADDAIVVTGIRASLARSQDVKRSSTSVIEALAAEASASCRNPPLPTPLAASPVSPVNAAPVASAAFRCAVSAKTSSARR